MNQSPAILTVTRVLRDRAGLWGQIAADEGLRSLSLRMLTASALALAGYGAVLGAASDWRQAVLSAVKLPMLYLVTLAICLPALYAFGLVFKSGLSLRQTLALTATGITVTAALSLALAPISAFFLLTAADYEVFKLLNIAILTVTGLVGLRVLVNGVHAVNTAEAAAAAEAARQTEPPAEPATVRRRWYRIPVRRPRRIRMGLLYAWVVVFAIVGTQLAWILRPFIGRPGEEFGMLRTGGDGFFTDLLDTIARVL